MVCLFVLMKFTNVVILCTNSIGAVLDRVKWSKFSVSMWSKTLPYNVQYRPKTTVSLRYFWPSSNNPFLQEKVEIDTEKVEIDTEKNASLSQLQVPDL